MLPGNFLNALSPYARIATAVAPFLAALVIRVIVGKSRLTGWLITIGTIWLAASILLAPFSGGMLQDVQNLPFLR